MPVDTSYANRGQVGPRGQLGPGNTLSRLGGKAKAGKIRLAAQLSLGQSFADPRFQRYANAASAIRRMHFTRLAQMVGGGECGPAPSSVIASAALQLAASRFAFEVEGDMLKGSKLADASRQNLLAAHELCAKEAEAKRRATQANPSTHLATAISGVSRDAIRETIRELAPSISLLEPGITPGNSSDQGKRG